MAEAISRRFRSFQVRDKDDFAILRAYCSQILTAGVSLSNPFSEEERNSTTELTAEDLFDEPLSSSMFEDDFSPEEDFDPLTSFLNCTEDDHLSQDIITSSPFFN